MKPLWIYGWLLCLLAMQLPCAADNLSWTFQRTGFRTTSSTMPQTALSMRSNQSWPVVYGIYEGSLNAYSLFPVPGVGKVHVSPNTNWHQIGTNLTQSQWLGSGFYLQADSGSPDGFAVSVQTPVVTLSPLDKVAVGNSSSGFQSPQNDVQAVKFDADGNPFIAASTTITGLSFSQKLFDVALSNIGEVGAVTQDKNGSGAVTFWQRSPLLGNTWLSTQILVDPLNETALFGPTVDLTYDATANPHIIGINRLSTRNSVVAHRFNIMSGAWTSSLLDTAPTGSEPIADVAAASNDLGIVGAAWVNKGALKYAYFDTNEVMPQWVVTTVATTTPTGLQLEQSQGVGLAFDHAGLPVISFVDRTTRQIWVAYDPPTAFGGIITDQPGAEGDFNGDGIVDAYDLDAWGTAFGEDGLDGNDFLAWQRNAVSAAPAAAAVPEPLALASGLVGAALLLGSTRKNRR